VDHFATMDGALRESLVSLQRLQIDKLRFAQSPDSLDIDRVLLSRPAARVVMSPEGQMNLVGVMKPGRAEKAPASNPMPIHVRQVRMEGGRIGCTDRSVQPVFAATLQDLTGSATGLSTIHTSRAKLDLHGRVDESPVSVQGELQPFGFDRFTDVTLILQNVE